MLPASYLASWLNSDTYKSTQVRFYKYDGSVWSAIPFQIDKRRKINLRHNLWNVTSALQRTDLCEYGYFPELFPESGSTDPFVSNQLQARDELVFLLNDAGISGASSSVWPFSDDLGERYQIAIKDLRNNALRYVYAFIWRSTATPPALNGADYTIWNAPGAGSPVCTLPATCPTNNNCGCFIGTKLSSAILSYKARFSKNWVMDDFTVLGTGTENISLLDRFQEGAGTETEDYWSENRTPRALGVIDGPVRVIRGVQGSASGQDTTRYDYMYPTAQVSRINLRVHPLSDIYHKYDHSDNVGQESNAARKSHVWNKQSYDMTSLPLDAIDGAYTGAPSFGSQYFYDWTETLSPTSGNRAGYVYFAAESKPLPALTRSYIYEDKAASTVYGAHGRQWFGIGDCQDGFLWDAQGQPVLDENGFQVGNDGGCPAGEDPEASTYKAARIEWTMYPRATVTLATDPDLVRGFEYAENARLPMTPIVSKQIKNQTPLPRPTPCTPTQSATPQSNGWVELSVSPCSSSGLGYLLFRGVGATGPLALLRDLGTSTSYSDAATTSGTIYRYSVRAYNEDAEIGPYSTTVSVTANDTTPPGIPQKLTITVGSLSATITWQGSDSRDLQGYHIFLATTSGGPYTKLNGAVHPASSPKQWQLTGLGLQTYYVVLKAVDIAGNQSAYSTQVSFVPLP